MQWISQNWVRVLFFAAFIAMHMFGHGGHGRGSDSADKDSKPTGKDDSERTSKQSGHQH